MASEIWQNGNWISYSDYETEYPVPVASKFLDVFDIDRIYSNWTYYQDYDEQCPVPTASKRILKFNLAGIYSDWNILTQNYEYPTPKCYDLHRMGAFTGVSSITSMILPLQTYKLGKYTFYNSSLEEITIVPDCIYYEFTFPQNCTLNFYTVTDFTVNYTGKTVYSIGEQFDSSSLQMSMTATDGTNTITRAPYGGYSVVGFDSSTYGYKNVSVRFAGTNYPLSEQILVAEYPYQYIIIMTITAIAGNSAGIVQFSEMNFYSGDTRLDLSGSIIKASVAGFSGEGVENLIDNNNNNKYCATWPSSKTVTITLNTSVQMNNLTDFSYVTGNDTPARDPVSFTLQYSGDYGMNFEEILSVSGASITSTRNAETQKWSITYPS